MSHTDNASFDLNITSVAGGPASIADLEIEINSIVRTIDELYDRVSELSTARREPARSLLAAAGMILRDDLVDLSNPESHTTPQLSPTPRELLNIALGELGLELKE